MRPQLTYFYFLSGSVSTRKECSNGDITLNCEALKHVQENKIKHLEWKMKDSRTNTAPTVASCDETLSCSMKMKSIEGYGINLSVSNGSLSIKRSSRNIANGTVEFWCKVQLSSSSLAPPINSDKFNLSLECKFTDIVFSLKTPPSEGLSFFR